MAKTISDLRANTRTFLDEATHADFTNTEIDYFINYWYHFVVSKIIEVYEEFYFTVTPRPYSTVEDQQEYTIATTFLKIERVEINYKPSDANNSPLRASPIKIDELPLNKGNTNLGGGGIFNSGYYLIGSQATQTIGFVPIPDETGTDNISVWGIEAPSDLSDSNTSVSIPYPDLFAFIIAKGAAGSLLKKGQQEVVAGDDLIKEANFDILNMQTFLKERQSDGPQMIHDSAYEDINVASYSQGV